jgi:hypothetical protein
VRFLDAFVASLDLHPLGFAKDAGRTSVWNHQALVRLHALFNERTGQGAMRMEPHDAGL